ncbi:MAG: hypothetical protein KGJ12_07010 [Gammaproteobacteria bacterium]|nr:hypothetical protein [Gammaproteobacteria bacterium]
MTQARWPVPDETRLQALIAGAYDALPAPDPARLAQIEDALAGRLPRARRRPGIARRWWLAGLLLAGAAAAAWWAGGWRARPQPASTPGASQQHIVAPPAPAPAPQSRATRPAAAQPAPTPGQGQKRESPLIYQGGR